MHPSVMDFLRRELKYSEIAGMEILEVGSQDVNGSPREVVQELNPGKYTGVDFSKGKGVDLVLDVSKLVFKFGAEAFDVVISTEMLEHAKDWRTAVNQMKGVLKIGGLLVVTTRSKGFPYHGYPHDYWRYRIEHFQQIFADMAILTLQSDPMHPGVFLKAVKNEMTGSVNLNQINIDSV
jgi:2-polyprenyl-3-methyl-5-hydroxy-6-metoxy-1,4-benzoquinol methylase